MNEVMSHSIITFWMEMAAGWIQNANMFFGPTALAFLCLNSVWGTVACLITSHMLKHTEQARGPPWCSPAQSQVLATRISILYTDKLTFSLPGKFPHERMKCKRLLSHLFLSVHIVVRVGICVCLCVYCACESSRKRPMYHLIIQIQNKPQRWREAALVTGQCDSMLAYVGTWGGGWWSNRFFFPINCLKIKTTKYCEKHIFKVQFWQKMEQTNFFFNQLFITGFSQTFSLHWITSRNSLFSVQRLILGVCSYFSVSA